MRNYVLRLASAAMVTLVVVGHSVAQPPRGPGGGGRPPGPPGDRGGPPGSLERAVDDLKLSQSKQETAHEAVRAYEDNVRRLSNLAGAGLMLKMKETLSDEDYKKLKEATDRFRAAGPGNRRRLAEDDIVERILSFDKNKTGKVTKDDLPERMQYLIEKGDTNKDGALDKDEIKKLAVELAKEEAPLPGGRGGRGGFGGGPGGPGGPGGRGGPPSGVPLGVVERAVDDLKLTAQKREAVTAAVKANKEDVRKLTALVRADLQLQMSDLLSQEEFTKFKAALDREPGLDERPFGRGGPPPGRGGPPRP
jgi:hypothetical protein